MIALHTTNVESGRHWWRESLPRSLPVPSALIMGIGLLVLVFMVGFAKTVLIPLVLAFYAYMILRPVTCALERFHVPRRIGAALTLIAVVGVIGFASLQLIGPAKKWISTAPERITTIEKKVRELVRPFDQIRKLADEMGDMTGTDGPKNRVVSIKNKSFSDAVFGGTRAIVADGIIISVLLYFLLVFGDRLLVELSRLALWKTESGSIMKTVRNIESRLSVYLLTVAIINACLGVVVGVGMACIGMPNPVLWGVLAGLMNFVPYLGAMTGEIVVAMVALSSFESVGHALLAPLIYFMVSFVEGNFITPMILGKQFTVNPVLIILSMMFWGWMWGVVGLFLAAPILVLATVSRGLISPRSSLVELAETKHRASVLS